MRVIASSLFLIYEVSSILSSPNPTVGSVFPIALIMHSSSVDKSPAPIYIRPKSGILSYVPQAWVPYGELMRLDKPAGIYLFYVPHLVGTLFAACIIDPKPSLSSIVNLNLIFFSGTIFMRGAACSWNDNLDQEYDRQVFRCKTRPIARGAVTTAQGHTFTAFLTAVAFGLLLLLPSACLYYATPSIFLLWLYPFSKRFTDYPQIILGLQMSLGVFMGIASIGLDPRFVARETQASTCALYASLVAWTVVYDTVYARQDTKDDTRAGVKSMAVKFQEWTRLLLSIFALGQASLLVLAGSLAMMHANYFVIACGGTALSLAIMVWNVNLEEPANCMWWFKNTCWHVGVPLASGLLVEYFIR